MIAERDTPELTHITEHSIPEIIEFVMENGQKSSGRLFDVITYLDPNSGLKGPPHLKEFKMHPKYHLKIPRYFEVQPSNFEETTLTVGYKTSIAVDITWHRSLHRVSRIEKPWREYDGQNWIQYDNYFSAALMKEDPWMAKIDSELFSEMDQFDSVAHKTKGNLVLVSHKPVKNRSLQILYHYHFDTYGETRGYRWLTARVIEHPGFIQDVKYNRQLPLPGTIGEIGNHQFKQYLSVDDMVRNVLVPNYYKMEGETSNRKNFWGIQVVS